MTERVQIEPKLLRWAQERSRLTEDFLQQKFPSFNLWLNGEEQPTLKQLEKFAARTHTPLGYLFLDEPPEEPLPIPDFRTVKDRSLLRPSPNLLETIYAVQLRQEWMKNFLIEQGEPELNFVGSRTLEDEPEIVATDVRHALDLEAHWSRGLTSWEEALRILIRRIEGAGVMVMINGVVENNPHRPLNVEEFRGFVLCDERAPAIFVNGVDAKAAQMFTLIHELAHLWLGKGGLSDFQELLPSDNAIELFCNKVAAEFLVPAREIKATWTQIKGIDKPFDRLARLFKVSPVVAARRVLDLELISRTTYFSFYNEYKKLAAMRKSRQASGGNFYLTMSTRLGHRFPAAVYSAAKEGRLNFREAYQLTGLSGKTYDRFGRELGFAV